MSAAVSLVLGAAVVVLAVVAILQVDAGAPPLVRGASAPLFELRVLGAPEGMAESRLALDDLRGRVVLVNFWATWCEPCESEMPAMERLYGLLPRDQFEMVAVAIDDDERLVQDFQDEYALSFPLVLDLDQAVYAAYQTMGVPESLLLDRQGRVVERYVGPREWDAPEHVQRLQDVIADRGI
ncbi:MAG: TlpA disulfide reductase family protein [Myxococcota bacterium]